MLGDAPCTDPSGASADGLEEFARSPSDCRGRALAEGVASHFSPVRRPPQSAERCGSLTRSPPDYPPGCTPTSIRVSRRQLRSIRRELPKGGEVVTLSCEDYAEVLDVVSRYRDVLVSQTHDKPGAPGSWAQQGSLSPPRALLGSPPLRIAGASPGQLRQMAPPGRSPSFAWVAPADAAEHHPLPLAPSSSPPRGFQGTVALQGAAPPGLRGPLDTWFDATVHVGRNELAVSGAGGTMLELPFAEVARFALLPDGDGIACLLRDDSVLWLRCAPPPPPEPSLAAAVAALLPAEPRSPPAAVETRSGWWLRPGSAAAGSEQQGGASADGFQPAAASRVGSLRPAPPTELLSEDSAEQFGPRVSALDPEYVPEAPGPQRHSVVAGPLEAVHRRQSVAVGPSEAAASARHSIAAGPSEAGVRRQSVAAGPSEAASGAYRHSIAVGPSEAGFRHSLSGGGPEAPGRHSIAVGSDSPRWQQSMGAGSSPSFSVAAAQADAAGARRPSARHSAAAPAAPPQPQAAAHSGRLSSWTFGDPESALRQSTMDTHDAPVQQHSTFDIGAAARRQSTLDVANAVVAELASGRRSSAVSTAAGSASVRRPSVRGDTAVAVVSSPRRPTVDPTSDSSLDMRCPSLSADGRRASRRHGDSRRLSAHWSIRESARRGSQQGRRQSAASAGSRKQSAGLDAGVQQGEFDARDCPPQRLGSGSEDSGEATPFDIPQLVVQRPSTASHPAVLALADDSGAGSSPAAPQRTHSAASSRASGRRGSQAELARRHSADSGRSGPDHMMQTVPVGLGQQSFALSTQETPAVLVDSAAIPAGQQPCGPGDWHPLDDAAQHTPRPLTPAGSQLSRAHSHGAIGSQLGSRRGSALRRTPGSPVGADPAAFRRGSFSSAGDAHRARQELGRRRGSGASTPPPPELEVAYSGRRPSAASGGSQRAHSHRGSRAEPLQPAAGQAAPPPGTPRRATSRPRRGPEKGSVRGPASPGSGAAKSSRFRVPFDSPRRPLPPGSARKHASPPPPASPRKETVRPPPGSPRKASTQAPPGSPRKGPARPSPTPGSPQKETTRPPVEPAFWRPSALDPNYVRPTPGSPSGKHYGSLPIRKQPPGGSPQRSAPPAGPAQPLQPDLRVGSLRSPGSRRAHSSFRRM